MVLCVLHPVVHCVLHPLVHCVLHPVVHCVLHPVVLSVLHPVVHYVLHPAVLCVLHPVVHCVLHPVVLSMLHPVVHCVLHPVVHYVLHPAVLCVLHPVVHCVLHPVVHCVPGCVLAVHVKCRGDVRSALHTVLPVHPGAVNRPLFRVPLHPALPELRALSTVWGGVGFRTAMGANSPAPLCQQGSRNAAENILQPESGCALWGRGGGSFVAAGRGALALRARRDAGTTSRSGEGACQASRRGSSLRAL